MGRGRSKAGGGGGGKKDPALEKASAPAAKLSGIRAEDIKAGDTITDKIFDQNGENGKRKSWTFHPEGAEKFTEVPYSDLKVTDVKVTDKSVKVTALFDKAVTKPNPKPEDYGKDFIKVTKTFKKGEITQRRGK